MIRKICIAVGVIIATIVIGIALLWYLFGKAMCGDTIVGIYESPNRKHEIKYYERNCGATTTYVHNVELDGKNILRYTYGHQVSINWIDDNRVSVGMASSSPYMRIYKILTNYKNIQVIFDENIKSARTLD